MSALVNRLKEQYETQYQHSITPVELRQLNSVESDFVLNKPSYAVLDTENNRAIHLHGEFRIIVRLGTGGRIVIRREGIPASVCGKTSTKQIYQCVGTSTDSSQCTGHAPMG